MTQPLNPAKPVLIVDDEKAIVDGYRRVLMRGGINNLICCTDSRETPDIINKQELEAIVLDLTMPHISGQKLLDMATHAQPDVPVIVVTGNNDVDSAVQCMKKGAHDYLTKPVTAKRILTVTRIALRVSALQRENKLLSNSILSNTLKHPEDFSTILTTNTTMRSIFTYIEAVSSSHHPIMLVGETGVGKEIVAQAIHKSSKRKGNFIAVNVAGLDDSMFTDTLFGHAKGAFTGASTARTGLIASASGGTLFLDEIGDLSLSSQIKLLRLLQEHEFLPLGQDVPVKTNARIVVATNADLANNLQEGSFRTDLYYRLNTHKVRIPPLRERLDDLPILIDSFLATAAKAIGRKKPTPPKELISLLSGYNFPGNIRELEAMISDAVSQHTSRMLSLKSFKEHMGELSGNISLSDTKQIETFPKALPKFNEVKHLLAEEAMRRAKGNCSRAAEMLGTTRQSIMRHIKQKEDNK